MQFEIILHNFVKYGKRTEFYYGNENLCFPKYVLRVLLSTHEELTMYFPAFSTTKMVRERTCPMRAILPAIHWVL